MARKPKAGARKPDRHQTHPDNLRGEIVALRALVDLLALRIQALESSRSPAFRGPEWPPEYRIFCGASGTPAWLNDVRIRAVNAQTPYAASVVRYLD